METATIVLSLGKSYQLSQPASNAITFINFRTALPIFVNIIFAMACSKKTIINCPKCGEEISLDDCFKDKAAENELKSATIKCTNQDCPWEGPGKFYMVRSNFIPS